ncbi:MAG: maleylpyruvate isomerase family mycothiol-dependent enzyme, partial [Alphaproteobacteria bacterium]|nr:maleylpyruvate isomerase family mycothiol-dependent enzyme [Alphaproteobacteria bacterium]
LHLGDWMVMLTTTDPEKYLKIRDARTAARAKGMSASDSMVGLGPELKTGPDLLAQWRPSFLSMCDAFAEADPRHRVKWSGPDMSVRSAATARQMETWAHGQEIYDLLRRPREATDRLKNIAVLGVRTFGWTFVNRGLTPPADVPYVRLTAPSGAIWDWNEPNENNKVEGLAEDFCRVVTQGRNISEVNLTVVGEAATAWMEVAQCFAGPPNDPPAPGVRGWS